MAELALDHPEGLLHLRPDAGLDPLQFVDQNVQRIIFFEVRALARAHGDVPAHVGLGIGSLGCTLAARISEGIDLLAMQQAGGLRRIVDVATYANATEVRLEGSEKVEAVSFTAKNRPIGCPPRPAR